MLGATLSACQPAAPPMDTPDTAVLTVSLQEGFDDDRVVVRVDDEEVADLPAVTTDVRIGLAEEVEVDVLAWPATVRVDLPERGIQGAARVESPARYLGVSVVDGRVVVRASEAPFGYL